MSIRVSNISLLMEHCSPLCVINSVYSLVLLLCVPISSIDKLIFLRLPLKEEPVIILYVKILMFLVFLLFFSLLLGKNKGYMLSLNVTYAISLCFECKKTQK